MFAGIDGGGGGEYNKGVFSVRGGRRGELGIAMVGVGVFLVFDMDQVYFVEGDAYEDGFPD